MNGIIQAQERHDRGWTRGVRGPRRGRSGGRHRLRIGFDSLESRRLLSFTAPPAAEFPLRQLGGTPVGVTEDGQGNAWVLLANGDVAEFTQDGELIIPPPEPPTYIGYMNEYPVPTYNGLATSNSQTNAGSALGLITYNAADNAIWFYEANSNKLASLNLSTDAITEYPLLPFSSNPGIEQVIAGPDGNIYFTEPSLNEIGVFDVQTGLISQFTMPIADGQPQGITVGGDGNLWFTLGGQNDIGSLNPVTHVINTFAFAPSSDKNQQAEGITAGPNDTVWFVLNQGNYIQGFSIATQEFGQGIAPYYPPPVPNPVPFANLWSIAEGPDGNIYYTEPAFNWVGLLTGESNINASPVNLRVYNSGELQPTLTNSLIASGAVGSNIFVTSPLGAQDYNLEVMNTGLLVKGYFYTGMPGIILPDDANDVVSADGSLWYTDSTDGLGEVGTFNISNQINTTWGLPQIPYSTLGNYDPNQMTVDSNGNVWFTETTANAIGEIDTSSDSITETVLTENGSSPVGITWDPYVPNQAAQFWMTEPSQNKIVSYNPATTGSAVAPLQGLTDPTGILADPSDGYLWITEGDSSSTDKIIAYDPVNEQVMYSFSTKAVPDQLTWGSDGNIWFTENGYVGVLNPPSSSGTGGGIEVQIPITGSATGISVGPSSGSWANTIWFTVANSNQIGVINVSTQSLEGYVTAPDTDAVAITLGPDNNEWFASGSGSPAYLGAVVLNPADIGTQVGITSQPPNTEETTFGGFIYGFGMVVAVENSAGQPDPFVQTGSITIAFKNNPGQATLGGTLTLPVTDGVAIFDGLTINSPGQGYTLDATYSLGLNVPVSSPFDVAGPATKLVVTSTPSTAGAGVDFGLTVTAEDATGDPVPTFVDPISLTIQTNPPGNGVLGGTIPLGAFYGSTVFTNLTIDQEGQGYTLTATDPIDSALTSGTSAPFNITAGPATQLAFAAGNEPPSSATAGANLAAGQPIEVDVEDQFGSINSSYTGQVTLSLANNASGTLGGTITAPVTNGVATFSDFWIQTAGTFQLEASISSGTSLTPATSSPITISPGNASKIAWTTGPPTTTTEGVPLSTTVLTVQDEYGNTVTSFNQFVLISLDLNGQTDDGALGGTTEVQASNGVATLSNIIIKAVGDPYTLVATGGGINSTSPTSINVVAPTLAVTAQPTQAVTAGSEFTIAVTVETTLGTADTSYSGTVNLTIESGPSGGALDGGTSATVTNGVATIDDVVLDIAGSYVLQAASGSLTPADSESLGVAADSNDANLYLIQSPQASVQAGTTFGFEVGAEDPYGNVTPIIGQVSVAIANNTNNITLVGTTTVTPSQGNATFSGLMIDTAGTNYTLTITSGTFTAATAEITITPGAAYQLAIPSGDEPGPNVSVATDFGFTAVVEDQFDNPVSSYDGSISVSAIGAPSALTGTTLVNAPNGIASFDQLIIDIAGSYVLQVTSGTLKSVNTSPVNVDVTSSTPAQLSWASQPPPTVEDGTTFGAMVNVEDQYGNVETGYDGYVDIGLDGDPNNGVLTGKTQVMAENGTATFSGLKISALGNGYTLVASAESASSSDSNPIDITAVPATAIAITTNPPSSVQTTQSFGLTVTGLDSSGKPDGDFSGPVTVAIATPSGSNALQGTTTINASSGVATFSGLTLTQLGSYTLTISSPGLASLSAGPITVTAGQASQLAIVTNPPASTTAGNSFGFEVQAEDPYGNPAPSFDGLVTVSLPSGSPATLLGTLSVLASNGTATFTGLGINMAGSNYTLDVRSSGLTGVTTGSFSIAASEPTSLQIPTTLPATLDAGQPFSLTVQAIDTYGNVATSFNGPITLQLSNRQTGVLGGTLTENAANGTATFSSIDLGVVGPSYTIQATSVGLKTANTTPVKVTVGAPAKLAVESGPPASMIAGTQFGLTIYVEDAYGNLETSYSGPVSVSLSSGGTLAGSPLTVTAVGGVASFYPLDTDDAGTGVTILATDPGLSPATTAPFTVTPLPATQLAVTTEPPSSVAPGSGFTIVVSAEDQFGNVASGFGGQISLSLSAGLPVSLSGVTTATASGGVATFAGLTLNGAAGVPVSIQVSGSGLPGISTSPISLTASSPIDGPGGGSDSSAPLVTMNSVQVIRKKNKVTGIVIGFSGALSAGSADNAGAYELIIAGKKKSFTARNAKHIGVVSASYNAANNTVTLTTKKLALSKPVELVVNGNAIDDSYGRLIDGTGDGQPGGDATAVLKGKSATITDVALKTATVDLVIESGAVSPPRKKSR